MKGEARHRIYPADDEQPDEHDRELRQAKTEITALRHRVDVLERTMRTAAHVLHTATPDRKR